MKTEGIIVVISAPSGAGKSTVASQVVKEIPNAVLSISCTTRAPRSNEKNGRDYYFLTADDFEQKVRAGEFLEWATVHGQSYGTPLSHLQKQLSDGKDVLLTIDPQGAVSVKKGYPKGVFIFLVPPIWETLRKRLAERGSDDNKSIELRLANARKELESVEHYDYLVVNDDLETAVRNVVSIIRAEHCRLARINKSSIPILTSLEKK